MGVPEVGVCLMSAFLMVDRDEGLEPSTQRFQRIRDLALVN
jgi:hypothetical protein